MCYFNNTPILIQMLSFISIAVNLALYSSKQLGFKVNIAAANEEKNFTWLHSMQRDYSIPSSLNLFDIKCQIYVHHFFVVF